MPIVAAYFGTSGVYCVLFDEKKGLKNFYFPVLNYSQLTKQDFELVFKDYLPGINTFEIIGTGVLETAPTSLNLKLYLPLSQTIKRLNTMYPIVVNNFCVQTREGSFTGLSLPEASIDDEEMSLYGNLNIYPHIIPTDINSKALLDKNLTHFYRSCLSTEKTSLKMGDKLLFTGERFFHKNSAELTYILILNCIQDAGVYSLNIDPHAYYLLSGLFETYLGECPYIPLDKVEKLGTLVRVPSACECLVTTETASSQFFDLPENTLHLVPLDENTSSKVHIRTHAVTFEKEMKGGRLGIIFDTRLPWVDAYSEVKYFNSALKSLQSSLEGF